MRKLFCNNWRKNAPFISNQTEGKEEMSIARVIENIEHEMLDRAIRRGKDCEQCCEKTNRCSSCTCHTSEETKTEERELVFGGTYLHFKGGLYRVCGTAENVGTGQKMVCYESERAPYEHYVRDYEEFMSEVDKQKYPEVKQKYRFELCVEPGRNYAKE